MKTKAHAPRAKQQKKHAHKITKRSLSTADPFAQQSKPTSGSNTSNQFVRRGQNTFRPGKHQTDPEAEAEFQTIQKQYAQFVEQQPVGEKNRKAWHAAARALVDDKSEWEERFVNAKPIVIVKKEPTPIHRLKMNELKDRFFMNDKARPVEWDAIIAKRDNLPPKEQFVANLKKQLSKHTTELDLVEQQIDADYAALQASQDYKAMTPSEQAEQAELFAIQKKEVAVEKKQIQDANAISIANALIEYKKLQSFEETVNKEIEMYDFIHPNAQGFLKDFGTPQGLDKFENSLSPDGRKPKEKMRLPRVDPAKLHMVPDNYAVNESGELVPSGFPNSTHFKFADPELYRGNAHDNFFNDINSRLPEDFKISDASKEKFIEYTSTGQHFAYTRHRERVLESSVVDEVVAKLETRFVREKNVPLTFRYQNVSPYAKKYHYDGRATTHAFLDIPRHMTKINVKTRPQHKNAGPAMDNSFLSVGYFKATH